MANFRIVLAAFALGLVASASVAEAPANSALTDIASQTIRSIDFDLCLPADAYEYSALGKHAVIKLVSTTAIAAELPLTSVFVEIAGVRVPLRRVWRSETTSVGERFEQVSFYVVPIQLTKKKSRLAVDFSGDRKNFGVTSFGPNFYDVDTPAFVRLDEYDNPGEPDDDALRSMLVREYPEIFGD